jgi:hypothetical protein
MLKALLFALELLFPVAVLAVLHDVCTATTRTLIGDDFLDHASL